MGIARMNYHQRRQRTAHGKPHRSYVSDDDIKAIHAHVKGECG